MQFRVFSSLAGAVLVALLALASGCGDDVVYVAAGSGGSSLASGTVHPGDTSFRVAVPNAQTSGGPVHGPFVIDGSNIHYDAGIGALMVDLTVTNAGFETYPLPVRLEFVALLPPGVTVLNPSNDIHGPGAMIEFSFVDRDIDWTPGETSLPRSVQFGVGPGVSIGFAARLHVGPPVGTGTIAGVVWHDFDRDGARDSNEPGIGGRDVFLAYGDSLIDCIAKFGADCPHVLYAVTAPDGRYAFTGLDAGHYTVVTPRDRCSVPTTPTELEVILVPVPGVDVNGGVSDFLDADFGVYLIRGCGD